MVVESHKKIIPTNNPTMIINNRGLAILLLGTVWMSKALSFPLMNKVVQRHTLHKRLTRNALDDYGEVNEDGVDLKNFNPLKQHQSLSRSKSTYSYQGTQISLRQTTMQELTSKLLESTDDSEATDLILGEYKVFLLEPLEDQDCVLVCPMP